MKLEDLKEYQTGERIKLEVIPKEFIGRVIKEEIKLDTFDTRCLYQEIQLVVEGVLMVFTQKLTPMQLGKLADSLEILKLKDTSELINLVCNFKIEQLNVEGSFPRWFPISKSKSNPFSPSKKDS